jgi:hypothetical protein
MAMYNSLVIIEFLDCYLFVSAFFGHNSRIFKKISIQTAYLQNLTIRFGN